MFLLLLVVRIRFILYLNLSPTNTFVKCSTLIQYITMEMKFLKIQKIDNLKNYYKNKQIFLIAMKDSKHSLFLYLQCVG